MLRDIGGGGFCVETALPIAIGSVHRFTFSTDDGWSATIDAEARYSYAVDEAEPFCRTGFHVVAPDAGRVWRGVVARIEPLVRSPVKRG